MRGQLLMLGMVLVCAPSCGSSEDESGGASGAAGSSATGGSGATVGSGATGGSGAVGGSIATGGAAAAASGGSAGAAGAGAAGSSGGTSGAAGSSATGGSGGVAGATGTGGAAGSGGTGGWTACNVLANDGPDVTEVAASGAPPVMTGGTVADGTYVLTSRKDFDGSCNCTKRVKLVASGAYKIAQRVSRTDTGADERMAAIITPANTKLSFAVTCPSVSKLSFEFTATPTTLTLFNPADKTLEVFTKQ